MWVSVTTPRGQRDNRGPWTCLHVCGGYMFSEGCRSLSPSGCAQSLFAGRGNMRNSSLSLTPWPPLTAGAESGTHWLFLLLELSNTSGTINGNSSSQSDPGSRAYSLSADPEHRVTTTENASHGMGCVRDSETGMTKGPLLLEMACSHHTHNPPASYPVGNTLML